MADSKHEKTDKKKDENKKIRKTDNKEDAANENALLKFLIESKKV